MALTTTTLTGAVAAGATTLTLTATTGLSAGMIVRLDDEQYQVTSGFVAGSLSVPVLPGQGGTTCAAHAASANVTYGLASDTAWGAVGASSVTSYPLAGRTRRMTSYSASGAITLPDPGTDATAVLNGTNALAMTVADPGKQLDGTILYITGNGAAAHTVAIAGGIGGGGSSYDVFTFAAGAKSGLALMACNGSWNPLSGVLAGNTTNITLTIS